MKPEFAVCGDDFLKIWAVFLQQESQEGQHDDRFL
jgi:hypothetical protein